MKHSERALASEDRAPAAGGRPPGGPRTRRGAALAYTLLALPLLAAMASLAIDYGRVRLAKNELQHAADAALRYGLQGMATDITTAQNYALAAAAENFVEGAPVRLDSTSDIEFGTWDTTNKTFTVLTGAARSSANALRISARRIAARQNAVPLLFGQIIGITTCDAQAQAIGVSTGGYGVVGLLGISMSGNASIGYWSPTGTTNARGSIASNGDIRLGGSSYIQGDARPGAGHNVDNPQKVSGSTAPLTTPLSYPAGDAGTYAFSNDNANIPSWVIDNDGNFNTGGTNSISIAGGHYYVHDLTVAASSLVNFTGPATIYVTGRLSVSGQINTSSSLPKNLNIVVIGSGSVYVNSNAAIYADLYAPQSAVQLNGSGDIYGSILGLTVSMGGTSGIHYDLALPGGWGVSVVK